MHLSFIHMNDRYIHVSVKQFKDSTYIGLVGFSVSGGFGDDGDVGGVGVDDVVGVGMP